MADSGCEDTVPSKPPLLKMPDESDASMRARLYNSLSQSFPHSQLYKALHGEADLILGGDNFDDDDEDSLYGDHLSNSCFASLRMDRRDSDDFDDDLRSLEWLQSEDLLKNIGGERLDKDDGNEDMKENEDIKPDINLLQRATGQAPPHLPYQPQKHVNTKPPYSFSCLIFMAVENSPQKRLPVKDIYNWILTQFPYFQNAPTGWKNSVRHNLSLNKCFKKVDKDKGQSIGKGSLWCIDPAYRPNLLQALRKTPYHPYHQLQMTSTAPQHYSHQYQSLPSTCRSVLPLTQRPIPNTVSPHLFPFLSRRLAQTSFDVDNEMKDVAQTLVSLKSSYKEVPDSSSGTDIGPTWKYHKKVYGSFGRQRSDSPVTITGHPYSDHAYSSTRVLEDDLPSPSSSSSIDEEYDFGSDADDVESDFQSDMEWNSDDNKDEVDGDIPSPRRVKPNVKDTPPPSASKNKKLGAHETDDDEQKKIHEGASALLNLAGLFVNNTSGNRNSGHKAAEKEKNNVKKLKAKKAKVASKVEKSVVSKKKLAKKSLEKKQEKKAVMKKRSSSKRKNAGSNGKYDNDQFTTTFKKASKGSDGLKKSGVNKGLKAMNGDGVDNVSNGKFKPKNCAVKKGQEKHKLKLSKTFGAAKKMSRDKDDGDADVKSKAIPKSGAKVKKKEVQKRVPRVEHVVKKKRKLSRESSPRAKISSKGNVLNNESSELTTNNNNNNIDDFKKVSDVDKVKTKNSDLPNGHDSSSVKSESNNNTEVKKEIISPAGDAPLISKMSVVDQKHQENRQIKQELEESSDDDENDASKFLKRFGLMATSSASNSTSASASTSPSVSPSASSSSLHKSPHFTRFSKKKAGMS